MIRTAETIEDPAAFFEAEPSLSCAVSIGEKAVVAGADIDFMVERSNKGVLFTGTESATARPANRFLGELYKVGYAVVEDDDGSYLHFDWYPSPKAVNRLAEELGLNPGKDVFKFVHTIKKNTHGAIPIKRYLKHFADGEYPQSQSIDHAYFRHDRHNDHAPGALLMPPELRRQMMTGAQQGVSESGRYRSVNSRYKLGDSLDVATSAVTVFMTHTHTQASGTLETPEVAMAKLLTRMAHRSSPYPEFGRVPTPASFFDLEAQDARELSVYENRLRAVQRMGLIAYDHFEAIHPEIQRVLASRGLVNNTVVGEHPSSVGVVDS